MGANARRMRTLRLVQFSMLLAIECILMLTGIGMIQTGVVSVTLLHIPVIMCGVLLGPVYGGLLGLAFGGMSLWQSLSAVSAGDLLFNPAASGNPIASVVMCVVPRILLGLFAALLYTLFIKLVKKPVLAVGITAVLSTILHTLMVLGCLYLFFRAVPLAVVFGAIFTVNGGLEIAASLISIPICVPLLQYMKKTGGNSPEKAGK